MQNRYSKVLVRSIPLQRFIDANAAILPAVAERGGRSGFDAAVRRLGELADVQGTHRSAGRGELSFERKLVRILRRGHMFPIVGMARAKVPAAARLEPVRMPKVRSHAGVLVRQARDMAEAVRPFRQLFHEGGMPADFIEQLLDAAAEVEKAASVKLTHFAARTGATDNIETEVDTLRVQLSLVDLMVRAALVDIPEKLTEWQALVRGVRAALRTRSREADPARTPEGTPSGTPAGTPKAPALAIAA